MIRLCIPTAFCSYTGEALDKKTPLLRSMEAIIRPGHAGCCALFGKTRRTAWSPPSAPSRSTSSSTRRTTSSAKTWCSRGRTLFGAPPAKGQELEDHYFGVIRPRSPAL